MKRICKEGGAGHSGFLEKSMSAEEVSDFFGHSNWAVVRRFVLIQDGGLKGQANRRLLRNPIKFCLKEVPRNKENRSSKGRKAGSVSKKEEWNIVSNL